RGPLPADTLFTAKYREHCDAEFAMYHDQGVPGLKKQGCGGATNLALRLRIVRTPIHQ
ncbi:hypothetical protein B1218_32515, partial [Pseudomonas ogarae]